MKAIFVLFDSLTKSFLDNSELKNFNYLSQKCFSFEKHYSGSLPCMPARRDLHTGRMHFLHCSWGPLEPFDKSFPKILRDEKNVHSHLITDHQHYFEQGGSNYHTQYSAWEFFRGQEGDIFKTNLSFDFSKYSSKYNPTTYPLSGGTAQNGNHKSNHVMNRECYLQDEKDMPLVKCFDSALEYLDTNHNADNWFLHLECFDPHEPFYAPKRFRDMVDIDDNELISDWPPYGRLSDSENPDTLIKHYKALLLMCDEYLGKLLDKMDQYNLWDDTLFILTTDHGLLFGEHDLWGKSRESYYEEISHIPLYIHHPDYQPKNAVTSLTQTPNLMPTILDFFGADIPEEVCTQSLLPLLENDKNNEDTVIFGMFGGPVGITDGEYVYYHYPKDLYDENTLNEYTLMPQHMRVPFSLDELKTAEQVAPFDFSQGVPLLKFKALNSSKRVPLEMGVGIGYIETSSALYNIKTDPQQLQKLDDQKKVEYFKKELKNHFKRLNAPRETYIRFDI